MVVATVSYLLALLLLVIALGWVGWPLKLRREPDLSAPQLALLRFRGSGAAVAAAITQLYVAGQVKVDGRGTLQRGSKSMRGDAPELVRAVYRTLVVPRSRQSLLFQAPVRKALRSTLDELAELGAVPSRSRWRWSRMALVGAAVVPLFGVSRAAVLPLPWVLAAVVLLAAAIAVGLLPRRTVAGTRLVRRLRQEEAARWSGRDYHVIARSWRPADAARVNALTGMVLSGLEPSLRRARPRRLHDSTSLDDGRSGSMSGAG